MKPKMKVSLLFLMKIGVGAMHLCIILARKNETICLKVKISEIVVLTNDVASQIDVRD